MHTASDSFLHYNLHIKNTTNSFDLIVNKIFETDSFSRDIYNYSSQPYLSRTGRREDAEVGLKLFDTVRKMWTAESVSLSVKKFYQ